MKAIQFLFFLTLGLLYSCNAEAPGTTPSTDDQNPQDTVVNTTSEPEAPDNRIPLYLNGLYATSTAPGSDVRNVFDRKESTIWETRKGAGPDEGIMLYFSKETYIKSIRVVGAEDASLAKVEQVSVYCNGSPYAEIESGAEVELDSSFLNVYLRFLTTENTQKTTRKTDNEYYTDINISRFDKSKSIGIQTIIIEGADGAYKIIAPQMMSGDVDASSTLKAESFAYDPSLLFDARKEFVWVEGEKGNGEGVRLTFKFDRAVNIAGLRLWNGYQRSESHFKSNARLKSFAFGLVGETPESYTLKDETGSQQVILKTPLTGTTFELEIQSAYKGWSYQDLAISELLFFDEADALFGIRSPKTKIINKTITEKSAGTVLEKLLDSRIYNAYEEEEGMLSMTRSAILRSDGTFVLYSSESDEVDFYETLADGNWEIIEAGPATATLNVFGKFLDFSMLELYYAGKDDAELSRIFKDKITIKGTTIKGEKLVNAIEF